MRTGARPLISAISSGVQSFSGSSLNSVVGYFASREVIGSVFEPPSSSNAVRRVEQTKRKGFGIDPERLVKRASRTGAARGRARPTRTPSGGSGERPPSPAAPRGRGRAPAAISQNSPSVFAPGEVVHGADVAVGDVVEDVVDDVLAEALLAAALDVDHGRGAGEVGRTPGRASPASTRRSRGAAARGVS